MFVLMRKMQFWPAKLWRTKFWKIDFWQSLFRVAKTEQQIATLGARQIYILPTRWGVLFGVMLIALLIGSINYSLSLGYYVTFLLASLGNTAMLYTWRNLVHLKVQILHATPVFAGDSAQVAVQINDTKNQARHAIFCHFAENEKTILDIAASGLAPIKIKLATQQRGWQKLPRLTLFTEFPLSLLHAWAYVQSPLQVLVYPTPAASAPLPAHVIAAASADSHHASQGDDEFNGHKTYQIGDTPSRVDWKASSRGIGMFTKQTSGNGQSLLWLNWVDTAGVSHEARISLLTRWVLDAHAAQLQYGLRVPGHILPPSNSEAHYSQALTLLALMP